MELSIPEQYRKYERLLLERDRCRKEAGACLTGYFCEFGELTAALYQAKMDCIAKKQSIRYCRAAENRGERIDYGGLTEYLDKTMAEYRRVLKQMQEDYVNCRNAGFVSEQTAIRVKLLYRTIAGQIHPELNAALCGDPRISELWNRVVDAYHGSDLPAMRDLEIQVRAALRVRGRCPAQAEIPDLQARIRDVEAEIQQICSTDPYQYKYLLEDEAAILEKRTELRGEIAEYEAYAQRLNKLLQGFLKNGVVLS